MTSAVSRWGVLACWDFLEVREYLFPSPRISSSSLHKSTWNYAGIWKTMLTCEDRSSLKRVLGFGGCCSCWSWPSSHPINTLFHPPLPHSMLQTSLLPPILSPSLTYLSHQIFGHPSTTVSSTPVVQLLLPVQHTVHNTRSMPPRPVPPRPPGLSHKFYSRSGCKISSWTMRLYNPPITFAKTKILWVLIGKKGPMLSNENWVKKGCFLL